MSWEFSLALRIFPGVENFLLGSSIVMEDSKTAHILVFKRYKRLKRKIKTPKSVKSKFNC